MSDIATVYGCIEVPAASAALRERLRQDNLNATQSLPSQEDWALLPREIFSLSEAVEGSASDVIHFAQSGDNLDYEWQQWLQAFEQLLGKLSWSSATVHLRSPNKGEHSVSLLPGEQGGAAQLRSEHSLGAAQLH